MEDWAENMSIAIKYNDVKLCPHCGKILKRIKIYYPARVIVEEDCNFNSNGHNIRVKISNILEARDENAELYCGYCKEQLDIDEYYDLG